MWKFTKPNHWHDKGFTLEYDFPEAKWILIWFKNGQRKPWYKITERSYRFKRWFFRKSVGKFSNIANLGSPQIVIYAFPWFVAIPKKIFIPMHVQYMQPESNPVQIENQNLVISPLVAPAILSSPEVKELVIHINTTPASAQRAILIDLHNIDVADSYTLHCSDWIASGRITAENLNILTLQNLIEKSKS